MGVEKTMSAMREAFRELKNESLSEGLDCQEVFEHKHMMTSNGANGPASGPPRPPLVSHASTSSVAPCDISFLSEKGLRRLFEILRQSHPEALFEALAVLINAKRNGEKKRSGSANSEDVYWLQSPPILEGGGSTGNNTSATSASSSEHASELGVPEFVPSGRRQEVQDDDDVADDAAVVGDDEVGPGGGEKTVPASVQDEEDEEEVAPLPTDSKEWQYEEGNLESFLAQDNDPLPPAESHDDLVSEITYDFAAHSSPPPVTSPVPPSPVPEDTTPVATPKTPPPNANATPSAAEPETPTPPPNPEASGCYLVYDASAAKLMLHYSRTPVPHAIGFFTPGPGKKIQEFKYTGKHFGRYELIGKCQSGVKGRKNYYSGWCQFVRAARQLNGTVWVYPREEQAGLDVDMFVYVKERGADGVTPQTVKLPENEPFIVSGIDAVACCPKHTEFGEYQSVAVGMPRWLTEAGNIGAVTEFSPNNAGGWGSPSQPTSKRGSDISSPEDNYSGGQELTSTSIPTAPSSKGGDDEGCYIVYDGGSSKLLMQYSKVPVEGALGFWSPGDGKRIQPFKFEGKNFGKAEIINCASATSFRKTYYNGWCQFVRSAKAMNGSVWIFLRCMEEEGMAVDMYVYYRDPSPDEKLEKQTVRVPKNTGYDVTNIAAVACLPRHTKFVEFYRDRVRMELPKWLQEANKLGGATSFAQAIKFDG